MAAKSPVLPFVLCAALSVVTASRADAAPKPTLYGQRARVAAATVTLPDLGCAGAVAGSRTQILTSAHCVPEDATEISVTLRGGKNERATVAYIDRDTDLALLHVDEEVAVEPLEISTEIPPAGTRLLFVGRTDRPSRTQLVRIERLGRCPSLPEVDDALFTTLVARPGDSGAPLVDSAGRVVGLVHGGARCHIAAPTASIGGMSADDFAAPAPASTPSQPAAPAGQSPDSFVWERTPDGFRVRFHFSWQFKSP